VCRGYIIYDIIMYDITYHPVAEPLILVRDFIITVNGIVYQSNKEPNREILMQNTLVQYFNLLYLLILYTVTLFSYNSREESVSNFVPAIS